MGEEHAIAEQVYARYSVAAGVCIDSRYVRPGEFFFGLRGDNSNGGIYAGQAIAAGAALAVVDLEELRGEPHVLVTENPLGVLQSLAMLHRSHLHYPVIAITGSNGKTTTRNLLCSALAMRYRVGSTCGNYNNHIGVPLTVLSMSKDDEIGVVELGASHSGEIAALCRICNPTHGLITSIGEAHLEGFGDIDGVMHAKGELFAHLREHGGFGFVREDDPRVLEQSKVYHLGCMSSSYSIAQYGVRALARERGELTVDFQWSGEHYSVDSHLVGMYNAINIIAAVHVSHYFNVPLELACEGIAAYQPDNHRSQLVEGRHNRVLADCYNANLSSMRAALESFCGEVTQMPKVVILGAMLEMGVMSERVHGEIRRLMRVYPEVKVLYVGTEWGASAAGEPVYADWQALKSYLADYPLVDCSVLLKGSHGVGLENLLEIL